MIASAVAGLEFQNDALPLRGVIPHNLLMPMNQLEGVQQDIPRDDRADAGGDASATTRTSSSGFDGVPALIDQTIALMEQGLAQGLTPPAITFRDVPAQVQGADRRPIRSRARCSPRSRRSRVDRRRRSRAAHGRGAPPPTATRCARPSAGSTSFSTTTYLPACRETIAATGAAERRRACTPTTSRWHTTTRADAAGDPRDRPARR